MIVDKDHIKEMLGVKTSEAFKTIEKRKQLENRLNDKGYELIRRYKEGRKVYYEIEQTNNIKEVYNNMVKYTYNTNKEEEFSKYFTIRTKASIPHNKKDISLYSNIGINTVTKWDNILLNKDIISPDGYFYFYIDNTTKEVTRCDKYEYNNFWKNKAYIESFKEIQLKYISGKITLNELQLASAGVGATIATLSGKYYYRIKKYKTLEDNQLYLDTSELIKLLYGYGDKDKVYSNNIQELKQLN